MTEERPTADGKPDPTIKWLRDSGLYPQVEGIANNGFQQTVKELNYILAGTMATVYGVASALEAAGLPNDLIAMPLEAFPAGHMTGMPGVAVGRVSPAMRKMLPDMPAGSMLPWKAGDAIPLDMELAADLNAFGAKPIERTVVERMDPNARLGEGRDIVEDPIPLRDDRGPDISFTAEIPKVAEAPPTIHEVVRTTHPETFDAYDHLQTQYTEYGEMLRELRRGGGGDTAWAEKLRRERADIGIKMAEMDGEVTRAYREAEDAMLAPTEPVAPPVQRAPGVPPPEGVIPASGVRVDRLPEGGFRVTQDSRWGKASAVVDDAAQAQARAKAFRDRDALLELKEQAEAGKTLERTTIDGETFVGENNVPVKLTVPERRIIAEAEARKAADSSAEVVRAADKDIQTVLRDAVARERAPVLPGEAAPKTITPELVKQMEDQLLSTGALAVEDVKNTVGGSTRNAERVRDALVKKNQVEVERLFQRNGDIFRDQEKKLLLAERTPEQAGNEARLIQAHYVAKAERFKGARGSAWNIYQEDGLRAVFDKRISARAELITPKNGARATLRVGRNADASSVMHEQAHHWLNELTNDAEHPAAPEELKADLQTVRDWVGNKGEAWTEVQQERFAVGFERYLMEGQAPSRGLAKIFEKMADYLRRIYGALVGEALTPAVKGVYDRLLVTPAREPVIKPERPGGRTWAEDAAASVKETPDAEAAVKANDIADTREAVGEQLSGDINERRRDARRGDEGAGVSGERTEADGSGTARPADLEADAAIGEGRTGTTGKSETPPDKGQFDSGERPKVDRAGNIRLDTIDTVEDVRDAIREMASSENKFTSARRGRLSDGELIDIAEQLGVDPTFLDQWKMGTLWTAEQVITARRVLRHTATEVRDAAQQYNVYKNAENLQKYAEARHRLRMVQEAVAGVTAETGRSLRSFRFLKDEATLREVNAALREATGKNAKDLGKEAEAMAMQVQPEGVNRLLQRSHDRTWAGMISEAFVNSLVSGIETQIVNFVSNAGVMMNSVIETGVAGGVGKVFQLAGRERGVHFHDVIDYASGTAQGAVDGAKVAWNILKDESNVPVRNVHDLYRGDQIPSFTVNLFGVPVKLGGATVRLPTRFLAMSDELYKGIAYQQQINVMAARLAREEGLTGSAASSRINQLRINPTPKMHLEAANHQNYQTFQQSMRRYQRPGDPYTKSFGEILTQIANFEALGLPLGRLILPFVKTPYNLVKYATDRTMLGLFAREARDNILGRNGAVARDMQVARMVTGNMVALGVGYMVLNDMITGAGPTDSKEAMTWKMTGKQPYSVRVGDTWVSYRRLDPFATTVGLAADMGEIAKYSVTGKDRWGDEYGWEKFGVQALHAIWRNIPDKVGLRSATSLIQAVTEPEHYGQQFVSGLVGSTVPSLLGQTARQLDPFDRETRGVFATLQGRIPWLREDLLPRYDRWGMPFRAQELGPFAISQVNNDPVNMMMEELGINIGQPTRTVEGVALSDKQYAEYVQLSGQLAKQMLNPLAVTPEFRAGPPGAQVDMVGRMVAGARAAARGKLRIESVGSTDDDNLIKKAVEQRRRVLETGRKHGVMASPIEP
jgi:hypothetical protein